MINNDPSRLYRVVDADTLEPITDWSFHVSTPLAFVYDSPYSGENYLVQSLHGKFLDPVNVEHGWYDLPSR